MTDRQNASEQPANAEAPALGLSGRRVTVVVLLLLIVLGGTLAYALWSYSQLESIRADQRDAWAQLREPLASRYREVEKRVAKAVDEGTIPIAWAEKFRLAVDEFRTTAQAADQYSAAEEVEGLLKGLTETNDVSRDISIAPEVTSAVTTALGAFNQQLDRETEQLKSPGCQLLDVFLEFRDPGSFDLAP